MKLDFTLTGNKEIDAAFRGMPLVFQDKVMQDAHAQSLKHTIDRAKLLAPEGPTGNLVDSLGIVKPRGFRSREIGLVMGGPRRSGGNKGHHGHLVEKGTKKRSLKRSGANRGVMPAKPFMEPAWAQTSGKVTGSTALNLARKLNNFMRRTLRK